MHLSAPRNEFRGHDAKTIRIAADFVECEHPVEGIKSGVLDAFRHHGR
jgi:hypothetical protein